MKRICSSVALSLLLVGGASAAPITYMADLNGANESPANGSAGTGFATFAYDDTAHTLLLSVTFSGLTGTTTAAHIHCCTAVAGTGTAGVATQTPSFLNFPLGVQSGTYNSPLFDLTLASSWNPAFVTAHGGTTAGAEAALAVGLAAGTSYFNIHTNTNPGGEIRGFIVPTPEPSVGLLLIAPLAAIVIRGRKRG